MSDKMKMERSWFTQLKNLFENPIMNKLDEFLTQELKARKIIYPAMAEIFQAFFLTPFDQVKVVIIGQDPYHGEGQAHGLAFSVKPGVAIPPSLLNIYKELKQEYNLPLPVHGHLLAWAQQGVFLLNQVLTVEKAKPASHQGRGWEFFTDQVVRVLSEKKTHLVFVLWGAQAQKKRELIDEKKHLILTSPHPSPLSAHRGFMGNNHFKKINQFLKQHHQVEIDWSLSEQSAESQTLPRK